MQTVEAWISFLSPTASKPSFLCLPPIYPVLALPLLGFDTIFTHQRAPSGSLERQSERALLHFNAALTSTQKGETTDDPPPPCTFRTAVEDFINANAKGEQQGGHRCMGEEQ